jgi:hypothetical protein
MPLHAERTGQAQNYDGAINTVGLDIGFTTGGILAWTVFDLPLARRQDR